MRKILSAVLALSLLALVPAPIATAHGGHCPADADVKFTVYENEAQNSTRAGVADSFCPSSGGTDDDDIFAAGPGQETGVHDIGDDNGMHDKVSSYSVVNNTQSGVCVKVYANENQSGLIKKIWVAGFGHEHHEQGLLNNDSADSARIIYVSQANC